MAARLRNHCPPSFLKRSAAPIAKCLATQDRNRLSQTEHESTLPDSSDGASLRLRESKRECRREVSCTMES